MTREPLSSAPLQKGSLRTELQGSREGELSQPVDQGRGPPGPVTSLPSCHAVSGERTVTEAGGLQTTFPCTLRNSECGLDLRHKRLSSLKTGMYEPLTAYVQMGVHDMFLGCVT